MTKKLTSILIAIALLFTFTSCGTTDTVSTAKVYNTVVLTGLRSGNQMPSYSVSEVSEIINETVKSEGTLSAIAVDGAPSLAHETFSYELSDAEKNHNSTWKKTKAQNEVASTISFLKDCKADDQESDELKCLSYASRLLNNFQGEKHIIIYSNGISTSGILNFENNIINESVDSIITQLQDAGNIPDLDGVDVLWLNIGDTSSPQAEPSEAVKQKMKDIWSGIISEGGGSVTFSSALSSGNIDSDTVPYVTPVSFAQETPVKGDETIDTSSPVLFDDESSLAFLPDSTIYADNSAAESMLETIAEYIKKTGAEATIYGGCAGDSNSAKSIELSQKRADTVKNDLIELGVSSSLLKSEGCGSEDPWHISGGDTSLNDSIASYNRHIVISWDD